MILIDTSVWIDHFHVGDEEVTALLTDGAVLSHPFVIGELALGNLPRRDRYLGLLGKLPIIAVATDQEVLSLVDRHHLFGVGIGYVDAHLLAAMTLTADTMLWTRDRRLSAAASRLGLGTLPPYRA